MLKGTLIVFMVVGTFSCRAQLPPSKTPSAGIIPMDLSLYTSAELRIFAARCDREIADALARGDTSAAQGWARVRQEIAVRLAPTPAPVAIPRARKRTEQSQGLGPEWYASHVKIWDPDRKHWHYEPVKPSSSRGFTPAVKTELDELIRQYQKQSQ